MRMQTSLRGNYRAPPDPLAGFQGAAYGRGGERGGEGREGGKGKGDSVPPLLFHNLTTAQQ